MESSLSSFHVMLVDHILAPLAPFEEHEGFTVYVNGEDPSPPSPIFHLRATALRDSGFLMHWGQYPSHQQQFVRAGAIFVSLSMKPGLIPTALLDRNH